MTVGWARDCGRMSVHDGCGQRGLVGGALGVSGAEEPAGGRILAGPAAPSDLVAPAHHPSITARRAAQVTSADSALAGVRGILLGCLVRTTLRSPAGRGDLERERHDGGSLPLECFASDKQKDTWRFLILNRTYRATRLDRS